MRRYETIVIVDPDLGEDGRKERLEKNKDLIKKMGGVLIDIEDWGNKRLAYEIKKKFRGHYFLFDFCGNGELVDEMERFFRIDDKYLKFMTIVLDEKADPEAIIADKEIQKAEKAKAEAEAALAESEEAEKDADAEETESDEEDK